MFAKKILTFWKKNSYTKTMLVSMNDNVFQIKCQSQRDSFFKYMNESMLFRRMRTTSWCLLWLEEIMKMLQVTIFLRLAEDRRVALSTHNRLSGIVQNQCFFLFFYINLWVHFIGNSRFSLETCILSSVTPWFSLETSRFLEDTPPGF